MPQPVEEPPRQEPQQQGGRYVSVRGTLDVQGRLWIADSDVAGPSTTPLPHQDFHLTQSNVQLSVSSPNADKVRIDEAIPVRQQVIPKVDQRGNQQYDLNTLLGTTVTVAAPKEQTSNDRTRVQATHQAPLQQHQASMSSSANEQRQQTSVPQQWSMDRQEEFTKCSLMSDRSDESNALYVYDEGTDITCSSTREWFTSDGFLPEFRCSHCHMEVSDLRPCQGCCGPHQHYLCERCMSSGKLCARCESEHATPGQSARDMRYSRNSSRKPATPRSSSVPLIARLRRQEEESKGDRLDYPVFIDDVKADAAYASSPVKPSHDKAVSRIHPATLLPDTGAVENLIGARRAAEFHKEADRQGLHASWTKLRTPKLVSGVGGSAQLIQHQLTIEGRIAPKTSIKYVAPVIEGESAGVPALLGLKEQARAQCVILPNSKEMKILPISADEKQIVWPPGTRTISLEQAPSGRLLVPFMLSMTKHDESRRDHNHPSHKHLGWETVQTADAIDPMIESKEDGETYPVTIAQERAIRRKKIIQSVEALLLETHIQKATTRTNIHGNNPGGKQFHPRSALYGLHLTRGKDITKICYE
eukprot:3039826-Amphidinium_carterae.2